MKKRDTMISVKIPTGLAQRLVDDPNNWDWMDKESLLMAIQLALDKDGGLYWPPN